MLMSRLAVWRMKVRFLFLNNLVNRFNINADRINVGFSHDFGFEQYLVEVSWKLVLVLVKSEGCPNNAMEIRSNHVSGSTAYRPRLHYVFEPSPPPQKKRVLGSVPVHVSWVWLLPEFAIRWWLRDWQIRFQVSVNYWDRSWDKLISCDCFWEVVHLELFRITYAVRHS